MKRIYLDHAAYTPIDPRVLEFAKPFLSGDYGNPSSRYSIGGASKRAMDVARKRVAELINAQNENCIIFTGCATESNNLGIRGAALRNTDKGKKVVCSAIEHMSVINPMKDLQKNGFEFITVPVDSTGLIDLNKLEEIITDDTNLVSVMYANNEIGTIQPIKEVIEIVHKKGALLHVDATAAAGRIPIDVQSENIDLLTLSSNDFYGPRGAGALYIKSGVKVQTIIPGGGQERGLRSGTENIFAIAGMGEAARIAKEDMVKDAEKQSEIRDNLIEGILNIEDCYLTGHQEKRLPHHASFRFSRIEGESILLNMDMYNIHIATGSACSSRTLQASHVLLAIGLKHEEAHGTMIITLGRESDIEDVAKIIQATEDTVKRLRELSPL